MCERLVGSCQSTRYVSPVHRERVAQLLMMTSEHGDPSQDVAVSTILFLVDGKLVLLQPTTTEIGELKYDMRIIAQNVETYALMRDHPAFALDLQDEPLPPSPYPGRMLDAGLAISGTHGHDLRDSLWYFDGKDMRCWIDMADVLASASAEMGRDLPSPVKIPVDFYPLASIINKGIVFGVESDLVQRRDISFAHMRFTTRVRRPLRSFRQILPSEPVLTTLDTSLPPANTTTPPDAVQLARSTASLLILLPSLLLPPRPRNPPPRNPRRRS